jgi:hypothetical protein
MKQVPVGRYLKLPVEQRICQLCHTDVDDEFHFLMNCDKIIHHGVHVYLQQLY